jgi:hypothetical protein
MNDYSNERVAWRLDDWLKVAGYPFSKVKLYQEIHAGRLDARKAGKNLVILTPPLEYFVKLPRKLARSPNPRARKEQVA